MRAEEEMEAYRIERFGSTAARRWQGVEPGRLIRS
jgi:hypothetical protein